MMKSVSKLIGSFLMFVSLRGVSCNSVPESDCLCGEANDDNGGRIVNGFETSRNKFPWMAAMFNQKKRFMCGGSVISERNIITAGHCVFYGNGQTATWALGMHEINSTKGERFETEKFELHPSFSNDSFYDDFDVAIVTVKGKIQFNKNVAPICLPSAENFHVGENAITAGWGKLGEGKKSASSKALMQTQVQIKSEKDCKKMTKALITFNPKSMICAYAKKTDACQGDSGGPLFVETEANRYEIVGVVSFGDGCAREFPGIYGKLATEATLKWIWDTVEKSCAAVCTDPPRMRSRAANIQRHVSGQ